MGVALLTSFITTFMGSALNLSIPSIDAEFEAGSRTVNWVITAYMLSCTGLAIPFGYFADRGRQKQILRLGIAIFTIASILAVFFSRIGLLILFRGLQGAGAAMIFSSNIPILRSLQLPDKFQFGKPSIQYHTSLSITIIASLPLILINSATIIL